MTPTNMSDPVYHDEDAARLHLETVRWPSGQPICPHCGVVDQSRPLQGESMGPGWFYCSACKDKFTVRTGTVWERSHIPLHKWLLASRMMASSKKGVSAHQLHRTLGITYKSAWFLAHRIREAMTDVDPTPLGGEGKVIEADETYYGPGTDIFSNDKGWHRKQGPGGKMKVLTLVERGGKARSVVAHKLTAADVQKAVLARASKESRLHTDEGNEFIRVGRQFSTHETVKHTIGEYARGDVTTNSAEGFFSIFKRGMVGVYQHCGEQHLHRYIGTSLSSISDIAIGSDSASTMPSGPRGPLKARKASG
jgi:transposase-like protein